MFKGTLYSITIASALLVTGLAKAACPTLQTGYYRCNQEKSSEYQYALNIYDRSSNGAPNERIVSGLPFVGYGRGLTFSMEQSRSETDSYGNEFTVSCSDTSVGWEIEAVSSGHITERSTNNFSLTRVSSVI